MISVDQDGQYRLLLVVWDMGFCYGLGRLLVCSPGRATSDRGSLSSFGYSSNTSTISDIHSSHKFQSSLQSIIRQALIERQHHLIWRLNSVSPPEDRDGEAVMSPIFIELASRVDIAEGRTLS
jgi:hypothetical protein